MLMKICLEYIEIHILKQNMKLIVNCNFWNM